MKLHKLHPLSLIIVVVLGACQKDESISTFVTQDTPYVLNSIDGKNLTSYTDVTFGADGTYAGQAPCNLYFGTISTPYPWFDAGNGASTRMMCHSPDPKINIMNDEELFLSSFSAMTLVEAQGPVLILSNDQGHEMIFTLKGHAAEAHDNPS